MFYLSEKNLHPPLDHCSSSAASSLSTSIAVVLWSFHRYTHPRPRRWYHWKSRVEKFKDFRGSTRKVMPKFKSAVEAARRCRPVNKIIVGSSELTRNLNEEQRYVLFQALKVIIFRNKLIRLEILWKLSLPFLINLDLRWYNGTSTQLWLAEGGFIIYIYIVRTKPTASD